jgi:PAS domain S-box-containing protein
MSRAAMIPPPSTEPSTVSAGPANPDDQLARVQEALRQSELLRQESQSYFEKSFNSSPAFMAIARASDNVVLEINPAFLTASGYTREEVVGRTTLDLGIWIYRSQRDEFLERMHRDRSVRDFEVDLRTKTGRTRSLILNADLMELSGTLCMLTVGIDITERRLHERTQTAVHQISQVVLSGGDLPALFAEVHRSIGELMPAQNFYVALLSPDRAVLSFPYFINEYTQPPPARAPRNQVTEFVINSGQPLLATSSEAASVLAANGPYQPDGDTFKHWLGAPLIVEGRGIGVIAVQDYKSEHAFTDADERLLKFIAEQTAEAIQRQKAEAAQRESRLYFEKSFHSNPALMSISRLRDGRMIEVNPTFVRNCGYSREEVIGRTTQELGLWVDPSQRDTFRHRLATVGTVHDMQADFRAKDGRITSILVNADTLELDGEPCVLAVGIDITERRRSDRVQAATFQISRAVIAGGDLTTLFAELHSIIGGLMSAKNFYVALINPEGTVLSFPYFVDEYVESAPPRAPVNRFTEYIIATRRPLLVNAPELSLLLASRGEYLTLERPAAQRLGAPLIAGRRVLGVIALQDYDREDAYGEYDLRLLNFVAEQAAGAVQQRQAEIALGRAEQRYRSIFENALEGLYVSTPEGGFISVNPALARMLGYDSTQELMEAVKDIGRQIYVDQGRRAEFFRLIEPCDEIIDFESEIYRRDGSTCWVSESARVVRDAAGRVDHFEGVATNITQRREAERTLREAKDAADAASRAKSYFLASVSHELRTPLNGILGYTQILRRDSTLSAKQREGVGVIHESADHLLALINDVLDLSKIEAGRIELHPSDFDLQEFANGIERVFALRAKEKSILFETAVASELPRWVRGDEQRLRQIAFNLISNAVKFTRAGGVVFSIQRAGPTDASSLRFSVSDTGIGISPEDIGKLFQPFSQVGHAAGAAATGTGLGLAISRSLVERMGGQLQIESKPGWGSRFWFDVTLPEATAKEPKALGSIRRIVGYAGAPKRILIVDDIAANRAVMVDMLSPLGFDVAEAADGAAATLMAEKFQPHLVLMDLRLPGAMDGLSAMRAVKATAYGKTIRFIAVSASAYDVDRKEGFAAGCDDFLAKPFREEELWNAVSRTLQLSWLYAEAEESRSPFPLPLHPPSPAEANAIYELAAKGDVVAIRGRAHALIAQDPRFTPFAQSVLELAARFKMKAIRQFVARYIG